MKISKYSTVILLTAIFSAGFYSCNSSKVDTFADSYTAADSGDSYSDDGISIETKDKSGKKSSSFSLANFFGADKYEEIDSCEINTMTVTHDIKKQQGVVIINKKANTVGFGSPYMAAYYYLTMDVNSREKLSKAVEKYYQDFENKKLSRNDRNSYKAYGSSKVRLDWGTIKSSTPNFGEGPAYFGYKFMGKSPYFTISTFEIGNEKIKIEDTPIKTSMQLSYFFNKAQINQIIEIINSEKIDDLFEQENNFDVIENDDY